MSKSLKIKFDPNQVHQIEAINQIIKVFDGLAPQDESFKMGNDAVGNLLPWQSLESQWLEDNLEEIVHDYNLNAKDKGLTEIPAIRRLNVDQGFMLENVDNGVHQYPKFTIEMETGTGKTYVYLRSIYELRKKYGFRKFIIIVPSRAIYEGVCKSFEMTKDHFKAMYDNDVVQLLRYDSKHISKLRDFSTSPHSVVMVMTVDAFNKSTNNLYKPTEKLPGEKLPYQYIQETRPIMILDESQNYLSAKSKMAMRTLTPLFALQFSATPVQKDNLIYRLTPIDAFKKNLVKSIEVLGVSEVFNMNDHQLTFEFAEDPAPYGLSINATLNVLNGATLERKTIRLRKGNDLYAKTGNDAYRGLVIDEINKKENVIIFTNGETLAMDLPSSSTTTKKDIFKYQIEETIRFHMQKQRDLMAKGIKVLSLFFIDRVANYVDGNGIIKVLFDEAFEKIKKEFPYFKGYEAHDVREGYFAKKRTKKTEEFVDTRIEKKTAKDKEAEKAAYELIMKRKERLLSFDEKVCFIFAHSALKEGWDNPNVFQICTLNNTKSENKKRQEIGRGLRIPVNQQGERDFDQSTNILTVVANESYEDYVSNLQTEYREDNDIPPPKPSNARRIPATRNDDIFKSKDFVKFWTRLTQLTKYKINVDSNVLIENCVTKLKVSEIPEPQIMISRGQFKILVYQITLLEVKTKLVHLEIKREDSSRNSRVDRHWFKKGESIAKKAKDPNLKGFMIVDFEENDLESKVHFGDTGSLQVGQSLEFSPDYQDTRVEKKKQTASVSHRIPNFIERAARQTNLTKKTLVTILKSLPQEKIDKIKLNPEAFSTLFVSTIKEQLADHIAKNIQYTLTNESADYDVEILFPPSLKFPQKELINGQAWSLYDQVQFDSEIERVFVINKLNEDDSIVCYFKFPPKFKIGLPKIIGNYNPDWGIIRRSENALKLELVRETKGTMNIDNLQWPNEKRKIECAKKHFAQLGIDYKVITGTEPNWHKTATH